MSADDVTEVSRAPGRSPPPTTKAAPTTTASPRTRDDAPQGKHRTDEPDDGRQAAPDEDAKDDNEAEAPHPSLRDRLRQHPVAAIAFAILLIAAIVAGIAYYLHARHFESTDDAFIDTRSVLVAPQVTGSITAVHVTDNQSVKAGDLLASIDPRDYKAAVEQAAADVRQAEAMIANLDAQIASQRAQVDQAAEQVTQAQAALNFANDENVRYQDLVQKGAGTVQRAQQAATDLQGKRAAFDAATAAQTAAARQIDVLDAQKKSAVAQIASAQAKKDRADADLSRTELRATVDGRIARLTAAVGALATPPQALMIVVPLEVWVTANFKESQLALMKVGQPVRIEIDAFGRDFPGHVNSVQAGSGTAFSLLPAENATGNYVKVVQRVPVKITFDQRPDVELGPGMSVVPRVTVRP